MGIGTVHRNPVGCDLSGSQHGEQILRAGQNLGLGHVGGDHGQDIIQQTQQFYDWAFENYKVKTVIEKGTPVYQIDLRLAKDGKKYLELMSGATFSTLMPRSYNIDNVRAVPELDASLLNEDKSIDAPIQKGDVVGELKLILSGKEIGRVDLLAAETVQRSEALYLLDQVKAVFPSFWFKFLKGNTHTFSRSTSNSKF